MPMTAVLTSVDHTKNKIIANGTITLAGDYATNGVALDLSHLGIPSSRVPTKVDIWATSDQGAAMVVDQYKYLPGTTQANGVVQIGVAGAEMAAAAFAATAPTSAANCVLHFQAEFPAMI